MKLKLVLGFTLFILSYNSMALEVTDVKLFEVLDDWSYGNYIYDNSFNRQVFPHVGG